MRIRPPSPRLPSPVHGGRADHAIALTLGLLTPAEVLAHRAAGPGPSADAALRLSPNATKALFRRGQARMFIFGGQDEEGVAMNDECFLDMKSLTW